MKHALFSHKNSAPLSPQLLSQQSKSDKIKFSNKIHPDDVSHAGQKGWKG